MKLRLSFKLDVTREWCDWYAITPEDAAALLALNTNNRDVREGTVKTYAAAMKRGEWSRTHQGIGISRTGRVLDGQHRLMAIVMSGVTVDMMVATGLNDDVFKDLDGHAKRSAADAFHESRAMMEPINMGARLLHGHTVTNAQLAPVFNLLRPLVDPLITGRARRKVITSAPLVLAAAVVMLDGGDTAYVTSLFDRMRRADLESLPPVALAFMKQVLDGSAQPTKPHDLIARGLIVFDAEKANVGRISVKETSSATERVRTVLRLALATSEQHEIAFA